MAAKVFGFFFCRRTPTSVVVREKSFKGTPHVIDREYELLAVLEFNSTRKRQSVIIRQPDSTILLYCKVGPQTFWILQRPAGAGHVPRPAFEANCGINFLRRLRSRQGSGCHWMQAVPGIHS